MDIVLWRDRCHSCSQECLCAVPECMVAKYFTDIPTCCSACTYRITRCWWRSRPQRAYKMCWYNRIRGVRIPVNHPVYHQDVLTLADVLSREQDTDQAGVSTDTAGLQLCREVD